MKGSRDTVNCNAGVNSIAQTGEGIRHDGDSQRFAWKEILIDSQCSDLLGIAGLECCVPLVEHACNLQGRRGSGSCDTGVSEVSETR